MMAANTASDTSNNNTTAYPSNKNHNSNNMATTHNSNKMAATTSATRALPLLSNNFYCWVDRPDKARINNQPNNQQTKYIHRN
jgi:predicted lipoprotein